MSPTIEPPTAPVVPHRHTMLSDIRIDNYHWLRDRDNPEVLAYLTAENDYTAAVMQPTGALQEKLYQEMLGRIKETDQNVPEQLGDYFYYSRTEEGQPYEIRCRKHGSMEAEEEVLLDLNALAVEHGFDYLQLGVYQISPDHRLLAYSLDSSGAEVFTVYIKDLTTGQLLPDQIGNTYYSLAWATDSQTFFYTVLDETKRPYQLYRHTLGSDPGDDMLVYQELDDTFFMTVYTSRSKAYIVLQLSHRSMSEVRYLPATEPASPLRVVEPRQQGLEYSLDHHGDQFFIVTNDQALNFRVMTAPVDAPGRENWQEFLAHRPEVRVDGVDAFANHLVLYERTSGLRKIRVIHLPGGESHYLDFPEPTYNCWPHANREFNSRRFRFGYSSLITPNSVFDYDVIARTRELKKQEPVLGGYDPTQFESERIYATASDGTKIPISLVYKKGLAKDGTSPALLYGYGSYEVSIFPGFRSQRLSLLERGMVYAIAHIRGGGELGRPWYEQGRLRHKRNTFNDFIACAKKLIAEKFTSSDRLAIMGRSAGGLLMGAVTNMRPELFKVVVAEVPFVDVLSTMLDATIPLTTSEYDEWGDPRQPPYYDYIKSYSPYDNVAAKDYPHLLVTAGLHDPRVGYWEPAKWAAKLRALKTDDNVLLLKTDMAAGHAGPADRYAHLRETAFTYAFILARLGIDD